MADSTNGATPTMLTTEQALAVYAQLLNRVTMTRAGITFQGKRDLYETLGYERILRYRDYKARYERGGIAARIIDAFPAATWRSAPTVHEVGKADETQRSAFEQAWDGLAERLTLWHTLQRLDRMASLGHYAILVIGARGQFERTEQGALVPLAWADAMQPVRKADDILYLNAYSEEHARIKALVSDDTSPIFGKPSLYEVDFSRRITDSSAAFALLPSLAGQYGSYVEVHASKVLHIAENGLEDQIVGTPRLRAVWNYLDDIDKEAGGTAEMTWQDAKRRLVLSMEPDVKMEAADITAMDAKVEEFIHQLRNVLKVQGIEVTQLNGTIPDVSKNIDIRLSLVAGTLGMPKRLLVGSERGELSSAQDENNWAGKTIERQGQYASPVILRPLIDRLIALHALPMPVQGYTIDWPPPLMITEKERAEIALLWTQAIAAYAGTLLTPQDVLPLAIYLGDILEFSPEQVQRILELLSGVTIPTDEGARRPEELLV